MRLSLEIGPLKRWLKLNEVIRVGPWCNRTGILIERGRDTRNAQEKSPCENKVRRWHLQTKERVPRGNQSCWHLDLGCPASRTLCNKFLLFKPLSVCNSFYASLSGLMHLLMKRGASPRGTWPMTGWNFWAVSFGEEIVNFVEGKKTKRISWQLERVGFQLLLGLFRSLPIF